MDKFCRKGFNGYKIQYCVLVNFYVLMTYTGAKRFKPTEEVKQMCHTKGISEADDIIVYCLKVINQIFKLLKIKFSFLYCYLQGARASNVLLALREAGFSKAKLYLNSWDEWGRDAKYPIDDKQLK